MHVVPYLKEQMISQSLITINASFVFVCEIQRKSAFSINRGLNLTDTLELSTNECKSKIFDERELARNSLARLARLLDVSSLIVSCISSIVQKNNQDVVYGRQNWFSGELVASTTNRVG